MSECSRGVAGCMWDTGVLVKDPALCFPHSHAWRVQADRALTRKHPSKPCPECGGEVLPQWSGVKCSQCDWWYCA